MISPDNALPPCVLYEDEHLLVVNKPPGWNTHAPAPHAGQGIYEWLRDREPRWEKLAIIHRLDKDTSGVLVFGKTPLANRALTDQFAKRQARKTYVLLTDGSHPQSAFSASTRIARIGERYSSRPHGDQAETKFRRGTVNLLASGDEERAGERSPAATPRATDEGEEGLWLAEPLTGRTHQIRVHAAENGIPIRGDTLYGGSPAPRLMLHAAQLILQHPATARSLTFRAPADFLSSPGELLRAALFRREETDCCRLIQGASDLWPDVYIDRLGPYLLVQAEQAPMESGVERIVQAAARDGSLGVYLKTLNRQVRRAAMPDASPRLFQGAAAPEIFAVAENGLRYELSFQEGYSVGLFLDQRDNRRRLLTGYVTPGFPRLVMTDCSVLNTFAYTCGFSVAAARAGARTTSLDLSKKYLDWGRRNFVLNTLDPSSHDFIYGDVFDWLKRLRKKRRLFDVVLLDPPTFSQSRESGVFRADRDYPMLVGLALGVLRSGGVLFASNNTASWEPPAFVKAVTGAVTSSGRRPVAQHYAPQPPDFPISRAEPAYLKTLWLQVS